MSALASTASADLGGREIVVIERSRETDRYSVTALYSRMLAHELRRRGVSVRTIRQTGAGGLRALVEAALDPRIAAVHLAAPSAELEQVFDGAVDPAVRRAVEAKRFVVFFGNPGFKPTSHRIARLPLRNARFVYIDADTLDYVADARGTRDGLAWASLPSLVAPGPKTGLADRTRMLVFAATLREADRFRENWARLQPDHLDLFDAIVEGIPAFDVSAWRLAKDLLAARGAPFDIHDPTGAALLTLANDFVYHRDKRRLMERLARFPVTYVVSGGPPPAKRATGSECLSPMSNDRLIGLIGSARASVWYPTNRMIGSFSSRLPHTLAVGAVPVTGINRVIADAGDIRGAVVGFDHRFEGLEEEMERLIDDPASFDDIAAQGPSLAARRFDPQHFADAMLALAGEPEAP